MTEMPHLDRMDWNVSNELYKVENGTMHAYYQYSGGQRIRKYVDKGSVQEERIYLGNFEIYRKFEGSSLTHSTSLSARVERQTVHISDDSGRIAMQEIRTFGSASDDNDTDEKLTRYIYSNHLQSAALELDDTGEIISYEEYHPYGTTSYQAMNASIKATAKRYRYTGKERDEESGLYYHGARYYIPWLCRWTASDPMESKYAGMSSYNYSFNNPVMFNDLNGADPGWVEKGDGSGTVVNNSNINSQKAAEAVYGEAAIYYGASKEEYFGSDGHSYKLFNNGSYLKDKEPLTSTDRAAFSDKYKIWSAGLAQGGVAGLLGFMAFLQSDPESMGSSMAHGYTKMGALLGDENMSNLYENLNGSAYPLTHHGNGDWAKSYSNSGGYSSLNKTQKDLFNQMSSWDSYEWSFKTGEFATTTALSYGLAKVVAPVGLGARSATLGTTSETRFGIFANSGETGTWTTKTGGMYIPKTPLAQQKVAGWDIPLPDPIAGNFPHTTLGGKIGSDGILYRQSATFTGGSWPLANGEIVPWSRVDWTTHGRPLVHPNPHQHIFNFNNGKNWQYGKAVSFP